MSFADTFRVQSSRSGGVSGAERVRSTRRRNSKLKKELKHSINSNSIRKHLYISMIMCDFFYINNIFFLKTEFYI